MMEICLAGSSGTGSFFAGCGPPPSAPPLLEMTFKGDDAAFNTEIAKSSSLESSNCSPVIRSTVKGKSMVGEVRERGERRRSDPSDPNREAHSNSQTKHRSLRTNIKHILNDFWTFVIIIHRNSMLIMRNIYCHGSMEFDKAASIHCESDGHGGQDTWKGSNENA